MHKKYRFIENVFEELDTVGEWYFDKTAKTLFFYPPQNENLKTSRIETPQIYALSQRQKEVYLLHRVEGQKYNEIAKRLNISVKTIETHMSRALETIREKLGNYSLMAILFWYLFV